MTKEENKSLPIDEIKKNLLEKEGFDFNAFEYENEFSAKAILKAMDIYRNLPNEPSDLDLMKKALSNSELPLSEQLKLKPELSIQDEGLDEWKRKKISKILEDANGSWVDLVTDGFDLGIEYYKQLNKPVYPNESVIGVKFEDRVQVKWEENMK